MTKGKSRENKEKARKTKGKARGKQGKSKVVEPGDQIRAKKARIYWISN